MIELFFYIIQIISLLVVLCYCLLNLWIIKSWSSIKEVEQVKKHNSSTTFSILIPVRNEEENISTLLKSIINQDYPSELIQLIVIDDHSTDKTIERVKNYPNVQVIQLKGNPSTANKKMAIEEGVKLSTGEFILTTDADCIWQKDLLQLTDQLIVQEGSEVVCGNINITPNPAIQLLNEFEQIDTAGMMLVTAAGIQTRQYYLANGAFLAYRKANFISLNPYQKNKDIASGDDMFLVQKMAEAGKKISFLKNRISLVQTPSNTNWNAFIRQRKRWAGKNKAMSGMELKTVMGIPYLTSLFIITFLLIGFIIPSILVSVLFLFLLKLLGDMILFKELKKSYSLSISWLKIPLFSIMHTAYVFVFGTYSLLKRNPSDKW